MKIRKDARTEFYWMIACGIISISYIIFFSIGMSQVKTSPDKRLYIGIGVVGLITLIISIYLLVDIVRYYVHVDGLRYKPNTINPLHSKNIKYNFSYIEDGCPVTNTEEKEYYDGIMHIDAIRSVCGAIFTSMFTIFLVSLSVFTVFDKKIANSTFGIILDLISIICLFIGGLGLLIIHNCNSFDFNSITILPMVTYKLKGKKIKGTLQRHDGIKNFSFDKYENNVVVFYDLEDDDIPFIAQYNWTYASKIYRIHLPKSVEDVYFSDPEDIKYTPVCPFGKTDCSHDPAFIKCYHPKEYKERFGDITPEEAIKTLYQSRFENNEDCYKKAKEYDYETHWYEYHEDYEDED